MLRHAIAPSLTNIFINRAALDRRVSALHFEILDQDDRVSNAARPDWGRRRPHTQSKNRTLPVPTS